MRSPWPWRATRITSTPPQIWGFYVEGEFQPFVSGKDLILELLRRYTCKAGIGKIMEFFGPGVANLDMSARATIANMAVDMGFTAGIFPSDEITQAMAGPERPRARLAGDRRPAPIRSGTRVTEINLDEIEPMVACPSNPDNVKRAAELSDVEVQQVIIGSSCNGSYRDFMIAAKIVEGKTRHKNVNFEINTGSRQTFDNVLAAGGIAALLEAGARIHESGCLGCIGMGQAPATGTNSLRTFPRNFKGRSGTKDDHVYLCSPETAAVSALTGRITDPRTLGEAPTIPMPGKFKFREEWFIHPPQDRSAVEIIRGPNIKASAELRAAGRFAGGNGPDQGRRQHQHGHHHARRQQSAALPQQHPRDQRLRIRGHRSGLPEPVPGTKASASSSAARTTAKVPPASTRPWPRGIWAFGSRSSRASPASTRPTWSTSASCPLEFADPADYDSIEQGDLISLDGIREAIEAGDTEIPVGSTAVRSMTKLTFPAANAGFSWPAAFSTWPRRWRKPLEYESVS